MKSFIAIMAVWLTINGSHCLQRADGSIQGCWVPNNPQTLVVTPNDVPSHQDRSPSQFQSAHRNNTSSQHPAAAADAR